MADRLAGQVAIVTGGAGVLGAAIVERLLDEGASVSSWDIAPQDPSSAQARADRLLQLSVDLSDREAIHDAAHVTKDRLGDVDILVNNAARAIASLAWELTSDEWNRHVSVNLTGAFECISAVLPTMIERRRGVIINVASLAAQQGRPFTSPAYAASKAGLLGLTVSLARHLGEFGITVNAINPGIIPHHLHYEEYTGDQLETLLSDIPLRRRTDGTPRGRPEDIAGAVMYLASADGEYVTGAFLNVNGGSRTG